MSALEGVHPVRLPGQRVVVREGDPRDLRAMHEYASDAAVTRFMTWAPNSSIEQTRAVLEGQIDDARKKPREDYQLTIALVATDELVGRIRMTITSRRHGLADLGYVLRRSCWGHGYATEAVRLLVGFGFEVLGLHRLEATCDPENVGSWRVLEKVGFQREGRLRRNLLSHGNWRDSFVYGLLADEWRASP
jgi:RimJ/RimL family protein N-acetyltransferase